MDYDTKCIPSFICSPFKICKKINITVGISLLFINKNEIIVMEFHSITSYNGTIANKLLKDCFTLCSL